MPHAHLHPCNVMKHPDVMLMRFLTCVGFLMSDIHGVRFLTRVGFLMSFTV